METLFLFVLLVISLLLLRRVNQLTRDFEAFRQRFDARATHTEAPPAPRPVAAPTPPPPAPASPPVVATPAPPATAPAPPPSTTPPVIVVPPAVAAATARPVVVVGPSQAPPPRVTPPPAPQPGFFERHPDLERFIGENLMNKIGIAVLVIGIGLLLRYAVGLGLISEAGRAVVGLLAGGALMFFAHRLRDSFRAFSSVLVAGAIAVFYATVVFAFHQYHLIGQTPAFLLLVLITGLAVALTLAYDRKELAVIALLGGFASPIMASTGEGNFRVLFSYLLILDIGMLVLAHFKRWHIINILSFGLTVVFLLFWALTDYPYLEPRPVLLAMLFSTAFYGVFLLMNLRYNLRHGTSFTPLDFGLLVANTAVYYGVGMHFLAHVQPKLTGLFTVLVGVVNLGLALYFHRRVGASPYLRLLLIGLVITFVSLAAPVQLEGNYITLFWAAEAVLLLWFAQRAGLRLVHAGSLVVSVLMLVSLLMDLEAFYNYNVDTPATAFLNKGWITGMFSVIALAACAILYRRSAPDALPFSSPTPAFVSRAYMVAATVLLYLVGLLELQRVVVFHSDYLSASLATTAYSLAFLVLTDHFTRNEQRLVRQVIAGLYIFSALLHITSFHQYGLMGASDTSGSSMGFKLLHYLASALMVVAVVRMARMARALIDRGTTGWRVYLWGISIFLVAFASQELDFVALISSRLETPWYSMVAMRRAGYPILWGIGSFLFMWYGMRQRMREMRVIGLVLFGLTLAKLFLFDLGELSEGGRVAAFILLGALLLIISFMYQKLKALLQDDAPPPPRPDDQ